MPAERNYQLDEHGYGTVDHVLIDYGDLGPGRQGDASLYVDEKAETPVFSVIHGEDSEVALAGIYHVKLQRGAPPVPRLLYPEPTENGLMVAVTEPHLPPAA